MRKITIANEIEINGKVLPILTSGIGKGCYVEMLTAIEREMTAMLSNHNKVLMFRIDVHVNNYTDNNTVISTLLRRYKRWAMEYYDTKRIAHVWCREVETAKKQHYHLFLMIDGNKVQTTDYLFDKFNDIALNSNLHAWLPENPYYRVKKDDMLAYSEAFKRASYLAKQRGKKIKGERANSYSASRIQPRLATDSELSKSGDDYLKRIATKASSSKSLPHTNNRNRQPLTDAERQLPLF